MLVTTWLDAWARALVVAPEVMVPGTEGTPTTLPVPLVTPGVFGMVTTLVETLLVVSKRVPGAEGKPGTVTPLVAPGLGLLVVSSKVPGEVPGKPGTLVSVRLPLLVRLSSVPGLCPTGTVLV